MGNFSECQLHIPHKNWSGNREELENLLAIERWANDRLPSCFGCSCYVRRVSGYQYIESVEDQNFNSLPEVQQVDLSSLTDLQDVSCGTLADDAMVDLNLAWWWSPNASDPDLTTGAYPPSARFVSIYGEGFTGDGTSTGLIAADTRLGLGSSWGFQSNELGDCGTLSCKLNIYPAGPGFGLWVAQSGLAGAIAFNLILTLNTVCGCSCVQ